MASACSTLELLGSSIIIDMQWSCEVWSDIIQSSHPYRLHSTCACMQAHITHTIKPHTSHTPLHHPPPPPPQHTCTVQLLSTSVPLASSEAPSRGMPFTTELTAASTPHSTSSPLPCYQVLNNKGKVIDPNQDPQVYILGRVEERKERDRERETQRCLCDLNLFSLPIMYAVEWWNSIGYLQEDGHPKTYGWTAVQGPENGGWYSVIHNLPISSKSFTVLL